MPFRLLPEFFVQLGDVAEIDVLVFHRRDLLGSHGAIVLSAHGRPSFPCAMPDGLRSDGFALGVDDDGKYNL